MSELESHYVRLDRVRKRRGAMWRRVFGGLSMLSLGAVAGAILAGPGWTWQVKVALIVGVLSSITWHAIRDTEAENLKGLCDDYKRDILDSIELVAVEDHRRQPQDDSTVGPG